MNFNVTLQMDNKTIRDYYVKAKDGTDAFIMACQTAAKEGYDYFRLVEVKKVENWM